MCVPDVAEPIVYPVCRATFSVDRCDVSSPIHFLLLSWSSTTPAMTYLLCFGWAIQRVCLPPKCLYSPVQPGIFAKDAREARLYVSQEVVPSLYAIFPNFKGTETASSYDRRKFRQFCRLKPPALTDRHAFASCLVSAEYSQSSQTFDTSRFSPVGMPRHAPVADGETFEIRLNGANHEVVSQSGALSFVLKKDFEKRFDRKWLFTLWDGNELFHTQGPDLQPLMTLVR